MAWPRVVGFFWVMAAAGCAAVQAPPPPAPAEATAAPAPKAAPAAQSPKPAAVPAKPAASAKPPAPTAAQPAPPATQPASLDLTSLEQRLRETKAIGVMTKIAIKNQVDDLLGQFSAYYAGRLKTTLAELRRPYELLVLKVLALLQDGDPVLAKSIHASREAIWGILADRNKFSKVRS
jgi:hypothetical protein